MVLTHAFRKALAMPSKTIKKLTKKSNSPNVAFFQDDQFVLSFVHQDDLVYVQGHDGISRCFKQTRLLTNPKEKINHMGNAFHMPIENLEWKPNETIPFVFCPAGELYLSSENPLRLLDAKNRITRIQDTYANIKQPFYMSQFPITCYLYDWVMADGRWARQTIEDQRNSNPKHKENFPIWDESYWNQIEFCNRLSTILGFDKVYEIEETTNHELEHPSYNYEITTTVTRIRNKKGVRLPTILEWMYAANANSNFKYAGSNNLDEVGYENLGRDGKDPDNERLLIGQKKPNAWGIHDMSGFLRYPVEDTIAELLSRKNSSNILENVPTISEKQKAQLFASYGDEMQKSIYTRVGNVYGDLQPMWVSLEREEEYGFSPFDGLFVVLDIF